MADANEIHLYGTVGDFFWGEEEFFDAKSVREMLAGRTGPLTVRINSGGGYVDQAQTIYTMLIDYAGEVHVVIDGVAMSSASLIAMAGDRITMRRGATMLIHDPAQMFTDGRGTEADHAQAVEQLRVMSDALADIYAHRAGMTRAAARAIMQAETVYDGPAAVAAGFANDHDETREAAVAAAFDYSIYAHAPEGLRAVQTPGQSRPKEAVMAMIAGLSRSSRKDTTMSNTPNGRVADEPPVKKTGAPPAPAATDQAPAPAAAPDPAGATMAERSRIRRIMDAARAAGLEMSVAQHHIDRGTSLEAALDDITAKWKDQGDVDTPMHGQEPARITADARDKFREGARRALMLKGRLEGGERNEFSSLTMSELARETLAMAGERREFRDRRQMVGHALTMAGAHTTSDFAQLLADVASKSVLKGWEQAEESFGQWTSTGTLPDFKESKRVGLGFFETLPVKPEGADYKYGTVGDRGETIALATYGRLFRITREAIINDDLSMLTDVPRKMGRAARRTVGGLAYGILSGNPLMSDGKALFHADHGNLAAAGAAPSVATLSAAIAAMKKQSYGGEVLNIRPRFLIVGPDLELSARQLLTSAVDPTASKGMASNPVAGAAELIVDARISGGEWYLVADPNVADTVEIAYLDGVEEPYLDEQEAWSSDGVEMKVRIDAGASPHDFRTFYKNPGA